MAITSEQKAALKAAGYTVKNNTVMNAKGHSVGGYNENGNIWSGSSKVRDILKSKPEGAKESPRSSSRSGGGSAKAAPAKKETKPQRNPARNPGGARPESKAAGLPAKREGKSEKAIAAAAAATGATRLARALGTGFSGGLKAPEKPRAKPATPNRLQIPQRPIPYSPPGGAVSSRGGGGRAAGFPVRPRGPGGRGLLKLPDILELPRMNKGGLVTKGRK